MSDSPDNPSPDNVEHPRRIRSFVLRAGRMTTAQQRGWDEGRPRFGLTLEQGALDPQQVFGRDAPRVLEIGFGMGTSLLEMAKNDPARDFIGIEVHRPGVGSLLNEAMKAGIENLRVYCDDAVEVLNRCIPDGSLARVQLYFPDPWHKKRHHKRRLVQPGFVQQIRHKLAVGGEFHMATDWENYAEQMLEVMEAAEGYRNSAGSGQFTPRPDYRPLTKFEKRGERLGHGVWDLVFERID
ncbi:tRNA (guanosine(46)-N7)-methyltransferase TrmB [Aestuariirhabdus litorea]|uniref:tRNA (guanine-N(7)-)-methyltransferase n=1 Tax=Aestuariirhabdus litorea TaxID=2528527 RepID=A0A3P3VJY7_9GAMM|nr:tRNA (guanosine(46)-N7)-methyltransferase TrmB [Aestuariirhabdus litorea]RRJ82694.1 tRNA (guanosine(46)-N7)-methyltransferase TrmB [Aestuariirhabdus litorea]RWW92854.1 tRNA (guanosine(46)-N7)-methyltransferase TrmB [Endozoicomonadaceae bacterium GTF-13]